ncbi:hypothetical protein VSS37_13485 [Candidatus Thiothrix sp. Deng01]|uniref:DUF2188 domain-containing protein n=1 Tax=Candidatus Thiothrix phosphatis TaxID=3112415 RepID=A0ABU6CYU4_9GAMM|nr:hypothetical protein [Candidatus Thiothrix sp. Deng01]MEB4592000.1 hypothetical protein [Candidatus Thiothrix sp. Deng01]
MQRNHITPPMGFTYSVYANGSEILETEDQAQAIQTAKAMADKLQTPVIVYENDEETGDQAIVVVVHPAKGVQP